MQTFADWGVDYVKLDGCYEDPNSFAQGKVVAAITCGGKILYSLVYVGRCGK